MIEAACVEQAVDEIDAAAKEKREPKSSPSTMRLVGEVVTLVNRGVTW